MTTKTKTKIYDLGYAYVITKEDGMFLKRNDDGRLLWTNDICYARLFSRRTHTDCKVFTAQSEGIKVTVRLVQLNLNH